MSKYTDFSRNPVVLNDFINYLENMKNFSTQTIKGYELDLKLFFKFILKYKDIKIKFDEITIFIIYKIKQDDIIAFLVYQNYYKNNCSSTRQRKLAAIKAFFKWLYIENPGLQIENPTDNLPHIQSIIRLPKYLTLDEAKQIQNIFNRRNCKYYIRNNAIITLFLSTGIRLSELLKIKYIDINFNNNCINVVCKGNKERLVYFSNYCKEKLLAYLNVRNKIANDNEYFFLSNQGKKLSKSSVENICKKAYQIMGLEQKHYTVHTLRHTAATIYFEFNNRDILLLKEILGHSTILSTEIYTHTYNNLVKDAVSKNPLNDFNLKK